MTDKIKPVLEECLQTLTDKKIFTVIIAIDEDQQAFKLVANVPNEEAIGLILGGTFGKLQKTLDGDDLKEFMHGYTTGLAEAQS